MADLKKEANGARRVTKHTASYRRPRDQEKEEDYIVHGKVDIDRPEQTRYSKMGPKKRLEGILLLIMTR